MDEVLERFYWPPTERSCITFIEPEAEHENRIATFIPYVHLSSGKGYRLILKLNRGSLFIIIVIGYWYY